MVFPGHVHRDEEVIGPDETCRTWSLPSPRRTLAGSTEILGERVFSR